MWEVGHHTPPRGSRGYEALQSLFRQHSQGSNTSLFARDTRALVSLAEVPTFGPLFHSASASIRGGPKETLTCFLCHQLHEGLSDTEAFFSELVCFLPNNQPSTPPEPNHQGPCS